MHRTQLSLEDWQYQRLKAMSQRDGRSLSQLVREVLTKHLRDRRKAARARLTAIEGLAEDRTASGRDHDRFLYGNRRTSR